ncbi:hypothetical protein IWQ61_009426 [Dispira simplex]|nr:hypothetical protein IWQ61_009426 [Dispira simplex]
MFKSLLTVSMLAFAAWSGEVLGQVATCQQPTIRKEIREMSTSERDAFFNAFKELNRRGRLNKFPVDHMTYSKEIHGNAMFLPWHRRYLYEFEKALQSVSPGVTIPYWDWTMDAEEPASSIVFTSQCAGGNGAGQRKCIPDGPMANYTVEVPQRHCLSRDFNEGNHISPWWPAESVRLMAAEARNFTDLREGIEFGQHGNVHLGIQGDMSTMHAPNDPIFFMHHAMVDKLWAVWQRRSRDNLYRYDGTNSDGRAVSLNDRMPSLQGNVRSVMDPHSVNNCVEYTVSLYDREFPTTNPSSGDTAQAQAASPHNNFPSLTDSRGSPLNGREIMRDMHLLSPRCESCGHKKSQVYSNRSSQPAQSDYSQKFSIPKPLPNWWIERNHLNASAVRQFEERQVKLLKILNSLQEYVPLALRTVDNALDPLLGVPEDNPVRGLLHEILTFQKEDNQSLLDTVDDKINAVLNLL